MTDTAFRKVWYCVAAVSITTRVITDCTPTKSAKLKMDLA